MDATRKASIENPLYTVFIKIDGQDYDLTSACSSVELNDNDTQMSQRATVRLNNTTLNTHLLTNLIKVRQRVFIYADDGKGKTEVFRGFVWKRDYTSSLSNRDFVLTCYDQLIYLQESQDNEYFSAGKETKDVLKELCDKWGLELEYDYETITHEKLVLKGDLSQIFTSSILNFVQIRTGKAYVIMSDKDVIKIRGVGQNEVVYDLLSKNNVVQTKSSQTMEGMITKVVIYGKTGSDNRPQIEATVENNTDLYGTLQKVMTLGTSGTLEDAKKDAQTLVDDGSTPLWTYDVEAVDIPWIRKGDKVHIHAGDIYDMTLIVRSITHSASDNGAKMNLSLDDGHRRFVNTTTYKELTVSADGSNSASINFNINTDGISFDNSAYKEQIWSFLRLNGFSAAAAAGIMGNMQVESTCVPDTNEIATGWYGKGYGLCQWTNTGPGAYIGGGARRTHLENWCAANGYDVTSAEGQLRFMMYELENYYLALFPNFPNLTSPEQAANDWLSIFEGCPGHSTLYLRQQYARQFYNQYSQYDVVPSVSTQKR